MAEISVVIPSYNHERYVQEAVSSVLTQTLGDIEVIVIDDGSEDNSLQVLKSVDDSRLQVYSQSNKGAHSAINRGLDLATSEYLAILNSDDTYYPSRLERTKQFLEEHPSTGLVATHIEVIDQEGARLGIKHGYHDLEPWLLAHPERSFRAGDDLHAALLTENYLSTTSNYVFRKSLFDEVGPFRPLRYAHDWDFALRLAQVAKIGLIPEMLLQYRVHERNTIRENIAAMIFEICWCLSIHLSDAATSPLLSGINPSLRVDQLLNSIYTYDCDRVLSVMLLENIADDLAEALDLLDPKNPIRAKYIRYIVEQLEQRPEAEFDVAPQSRSLIARVMRRLRSV